MTLTFSLLGIRCVNMKILYTINNPHGIGADRWLYEGYRDAFQQEGHECFALTEFDDFELKVREIKPDIFLLDFACLEKAYAKRPLFPAFFSEIKNQGTKIFITADVGIDTEVSQKDRIALFRKFSEFFDVGRSHFAPEIFSPFQDILGKKVYFIPQAANTAYHFPETPSKKFACDIAFVGSYYCEKKQQFNELLLPLRRKYDVRIYGTGWTVKDRILRLGSGIARKLRLEGLTKIINKNRLSISVDDERRLYASAKIWVNIHEYYKDGMVKGFSNEREFIVPSCGGFQISDYIPGLERYFKLGEEIVVIRSKKEWFEAIDYYLTHEQERKAIQARGTARVLRDHTYSHRVRQLLDIYQSLES
jgi:spore maturation protein CgeB